MGYKYFYIDDDPETTIVETARGLSIKKELIEVTPFQHKVWQEQIEFLKANQKEFDGLLVDWKLNKKNTAQEEANYNIEALVQQLRTLINNGKLKDFPIVLCSAEYGFKKNFEKEFTAQDLFDTVYEKNEFDEIKDIVIWQLFSLSEAYDKIREQLDLETILSRSENLIDYRLKDNILSMIQSQHPHHEIVKFVLKNLVSVSGLLIDEYMLASRLGVDIKSSKEDWRKLLSIIDAFHYKGILYGGWQRWWASDLIEWWRTNLDAELGDLFAEERVEKLNEKFGLKLNAALKVEKDSNTRFWTICRKTKKPISLKDAILCSEDYQKVPWQEDEYFSIDVALNEPITNIHPLDRDKVEKLKVLYTRSRDGK